MMLEIVWEVEFYITGLGKCEEWLTGGEITNMIIVSGIWICNFDHLKYDLIKNY